jgi:hypothetical protein
VLPLKVGMGTEQMALLALLDDALAQGSIHGLWP